MKQYFYLIIFILLYPDAGLMAQTGRYIAEPAGFCSGIFDEFSPVFYRGGLVYCSNRNDNSLVTYSRDQRGLFKIFYVEGKENKGWKEPGIFSREITSGYNDGPVSFSDSGNTIYYSRNNFVANRIGSISDPSDKLGIYIARYAGGSWTGIRPFPYNDPLWNFTTPSVSPGGLRLYFSSDMPGGYGGMDLYYCDRKEEGWESPVNLGPEINTSWNESFPFAGPYRKLYFSSEGHNSFGGKDIFFTQEVDGKWIEPVHLDPAINSPADDFGLVADSTMEKGYFSSNRRKTDDIFSFRLQPPDFEECDTLSKGIYCFTFYDERHQLIDTIPVIYEWNFGNGVTRRGEEVGHCFAGPGEYRVRLRILDALTGDTISENTEYGVNLEEQAGPYINAYNVGIVDEPITFSSTVSVTKGTAGMDYLWDFGDGFEPGGPSVSRSFGRRGEYTVRLGLTGKGDSSGIVSKNCVMKNIRIFNSYQEYAADKEKNNNGRGTETPFLNADHRIGTRISFMDDLPEPVKERIRKGLRENDCCVIGFNRYGIIKDSSPCLGQIADLLHENINIRLEVIFHTAREEKLPGNLEISRQWAQEIEFFFRNSGLHDQVRSEGYGFTRPVFGEEIQENEGDGVAEFIFMRN